MKHIRHEEFIDYRNYKAEAKHLIKDLSSGQKYDLLEKVVDMQKRNQSDNRRKELEAVQSAILNDETLDYDRMRKLVVGYRSEMARDARMQDGNKKPHRKKQ